MLPQKIYTVDEAKKKLESYCAYQERCHKEVRQKLKDMKMIPEAIDVIMVHLLEHNFLNEERFAKTFVRGKFRIKKWGRYRLTSELKLKGISKVNINQALKEISESDYNEVFHTLAEKRWNSLTTTNILKKKRQFIDYLTYRGWESNRIYDKLREFD